MDPVPDLIHILKFMEVPEIEPATSWSAVRRADPYTNEADIFYCIIKIKEKYDFYNEQI